MSAMVSKGHAWRLANPEKYAAQRAAYRARPEVKALEVQRARAYRAENPEKSRATVKDWREKTGYTTQPGRVAKLEQIAGRPRPETCECCGRVGKICWDHDHQTGAFRGWICDRCNSALGMAQDSPETLRALARYLEAGRV